MSQKNEKQLAWLQRPQGRGYNMSACVGLSVKLGLQQRQQTPRTSGRCRWSRRGFFLKDASRVRSGAGKGRNSAVGCISVSRSDGWVAALFVLCCHTALAPAWALMRGGRTAGQEHDGPRTQVIRHAAVLLGQGDTWRQRGEERRRGRPRGRPRGRARGRPPHGNPRVALFDIRRWRTNRLTRLIKVTSHPAYLRRSLPEMKFEFGFITIIPL